MKRLNFVGLLLCIFAVSILAGCATPILKSSSMDTSWYGKSGALSAPVKDVNTTEETSNPTATAAKKGSWWMPDEAPAGKGSTVWGNRGYVYLAEAEKAPKKAVAKKSPGKAVVKKSSLQDIYFLFDSAELTPSARKILDANVKVLKENPKAKMVLMGYASPEGPTDYNRKLSGRRAQSVKNYMVKNGIPEDSISITAEGEMEVSVANYPSARKVQYRIISR
ncbi:MAG: OmpA family protein [Candidatus Omnitrophota bacterium]